ncbi:phenylacetate-CoA oxygenase subunit PaaC [Gangjinia marincola]|uniref:Phenylacetate-CoA oxygenase subunit PaaC n=1 Tax=Gangjinia marincola TaxID=578463 RepID=A0ABP3XQT0_9FLAO
MKNLKNYILQIADNNLILGQRLSELCGHGPSLETDIACTNIALDLLGQTRSYYQYAASLENDDVTEDDLAYQRTEREYKNVLLVEYPNKHFGYIIMRQFLFDVFHQLFLTELLSSKDEQLAAIARKGIKEANYHVSFSGDWIKRLGDGTQESHEKVQEALDALWSYTGELFDPSEYEKQLIEEGIAVNLEKIKPIYLERVSKLFAEATLTIPETKWFKKGGKQGVHTEHMGYILADLQYMQRTYPNMSW